jgi:hypothetical protein
VDGSELSDRQYEKPEKYGDEVLWECTSLEEKVKDYPYSRPSTSISPVGTSRMTSGLTWISISTHAGT